MDSMKTDPRKADPRKARPRKTVLIVALIVVIAVIVAGLSWALVSGQRADGTRAESSASSSLSSSSKSSKGSHSRKGSGAARRKSDPSGQSGQPDSSGGSDASGASDASDAPATSKKDGSDVRRAPAVPLPQVGKRAGDLFAATYKACGPGKPFDESNDSQESLILEKDNRTLMLLSGDKSDFSLYGCVVRQLGIPADQARKMEAKEVSQGLQRFDFNGLTAQWSYSPSGLDLYVTQKQ